MSFSLYNSATVITDLHLKYGFFVGFLMPAWFNGIQNLFQERFFSAELLNLFLIDLYLPQGKLHFSLKRICHTNASTDQSTQNFKKVIWLLFLMRLSKTTFFGSSPSCKQQGTKLIYKRTMLLSFACNFDSTTKQIQLQSVPCLLAAEPFVW
ncbi:MAG: hypothetical protein LGB06_08390 [Sulfurovum sp.]|nr:hypothetical protein [Sulfurovum sp.]